MAIPFNPPDWLIQEYMRRKTPAQEASDAIQTGLNTYLEIDQAKRRNALAEQQAASENQRAAMQGHQIFTDTGNPNFLSAEIQQGMSNPAQGPVTAEGVGPRKSPVIEYFSQFKEKFPQGYKGAQYAPEQQALGADGAPAVKYQQVPNLINGKPAVFNPVTRTYEIAQVVDPSAPGQPVNDPVFTPRVQPAVPASQSAELGDFQNILDQLNIVKTNFDPKYVGMADSRVQGLKQMTGIGADPKAATFKASLGAIRNKLLNLLSGAAISPAEYDRLLQQLPNEGASEVDFQSKLASFEQNIQGVLSSRQKAFQASGYRTAPTTPAPTSPTAAPTSGSLAPDKQARLAELRRKRAEGTLR